LGGFGYLQAGVLDAHSCRHDLCGARDRDRGVNQDHLVESASPRDWSMVMIRISPD
jgi:hypothetical protein